MTGGPNGGWIGLVRGRNAHRGDNGSDARSGDADEDKLRADLAVRLDDRNLPARPRVSTDSVPRMPDEFMTVAEVAAILKLNQQTVRNRIDSGFLPSGSGGGCGSSAQTSMRSCRRATAVRRPVNLGLGFGRARCPRAGRNPSLQAASPPVDHLQTTQ